MLAGTLIILLSVQQSLLYQVRSVHTVSYQLIPNYLPTDT